MGKIIVPTIICPSCESKIKCPETIIGRNVSCPKCKSLFLASISNDPLIPLQVELENNPPPNNFNDSETILKKSKNLDEKFCTECGEIIKLKAEICPKCGVRQLQNNAGLSINFGELAPNGKNRITAALLALFLGGFGIHKFHLGQSGAGIIYLLFFWTFIPAILAFIDFIVLMTMSDSSFNQTYGNAN